MTAFLAGAALGVTGSAHCVAMCGPLLAAIAPRGRRAVLHHAGRGLVYVLLGVLAGLAGAGMNAAGLGRWWAVLLAIVLLFHAASRIVAIPNVGRRERIAQGTRVAAAAIRTWALRHPATGAVALGAMNGLLPCGLVYGATAASAGLGEPSAAVSLMIGFAIGTTPALTVGSLSVDWTRRRIPVLTRLTPVLLVVLAALLMVRALSTPRSATHHHPAVTGTGTAASVIHAP